MTHAASMMDATAPADNVLDNAYSNMPTAIAAPADDVDVDDNAISTATATDMLDDEDVLNNNVKWILDAANSLNDDVDANAPMKSNTEHNGQAQC
eukprot:CAMPEP_0172521728 /NCGR_PEP_ID=MMETSP1066-20121228/292747_1 /TAXON_ID=671091 /ORGANISM="Coscinodiscus wailesii, Strain CCMP2513" /LENGTH=94 /DNA_ID=CAMNT_0013304681 /DNA_START=697 /DNA_END=981 /DNA_ORIENTATION=-